MKMTPQPQNYRFVSCRPMIFNLFAGCKRKKTPYVPFLAITAKFYINVFRDQPKASTTQTKYQTCLACKRFCTKLREHHVG